MTGVELELEAAEQAFKKAMVSCYVDRIPLCHGGLDARQFGARNDPRPTDTLSLIGEGVLGHTTMSRQTHLLHARGDVAVVSGRGTNTGWYRWLPIQADEWESDIYRPVGGERGTRSS